jgi:FKBP-type peptidyl-prolyl cis-trans isomerase SlyD
MKIESNKVVSLSYCLETGGEVVETVTAQRPMKFCFGSGTLLPQFEAQLLGKCAGDRFDFTLPAADAYGEFDEQAVFVLPFSVFEVDGALDERLQEGARIPMQDSEGNRLYGRVEEFTADGVRMNFNHEMAGCNLHFTGEVLEVRDLVPEDFATSCNCGCHRDHNCGNDCGNDCGC